MYQTGTVEESGNYFQHSCTTDFTPGLTVDNQTIRESFDAHFNFWIILQRTDCKNRDVENGESKRGGKRQ